MTQGYSILLCLVDGTATGLITAEIMNWAGHVIINPPRKLAGSMVPGRDNCSRFPIPIGKGDPT